MMNAAIVEVMETTGNTLPAAHSNQHLMEALATDIHKLTGFENIGIPFCMTVEAEALGSEIDLGTLACEPKIAVEAFASVTEVAYQPVSAIVNSQRAITLINTVGKLSQANEDIPIIGSITGPVSTAASIVDPITFFKELRKQRDAAHRVVDYVTNQTIEFACQLVDNGATVISIADPTATGEILGPRFFEEYALPALNRIVDAVNALGAPVIIHICGDVSMIKGSLAQLHSQAISTDSVVSLPKFKAEYPQVTTMGNVSTYLLEYGDAEKVRRTTEGLIDRGIDIISPACGLSTSTKLEALLALTETVSSR
jgi:[methyl-Co(III) methanol-specific corrinoid protein]:coenzyme M methyltransferase